VEQFVKEACQKRRKSFKRVLTTEEAFAYLHNWLDFPSVSLIDAELEDISTTETLLTAAGTAANLVSDAQIAAAALRLKATVHSADSDFERFPKVKWHNPLSA
jgi:predicted nucleic acid-binding protein